ncbi:hypothetical protein Taro_040221 [Colocasia esculenta]|uniref:Uncharacterized protein n=1 Tax=Colocasia esculenta TaxID=4460 RepID=A0A843WPN2_COLES|nr:hypothetical protein [Colocasia esculenta]
MPDGEIVLTEKGVWCSDRIGGSENTTSVSYAYLLTMEEPLARAVQSEHDDSNLFECNDSMKSRR